MNDPVRWKAVNQILDGALDLPPAERDAYLGQACGTDREMREEIEKLLTACERTGWFLDQQAASFASPLLTAEASPGTRFGPYEIVTLLGAGGMGAVYRARDSRIGRDVAVKVLPPELAADPDRLQRFEQEARTIGQLNHPNLLTLYDLGTAEGHPYLVTELLEGGTLRERLRGGPLPIEEVRDLGRQIAQGLAAAHERRIVHRDLKPENLFVTRDGRAKILDFGLAKLLPALGGENADGAQTSGGMIMGTAGYMAPEQVMGDPVDHRTDLFSLGCVLYEMATGTRAFQRSTPQGTMMAILSAEPTDPVSLRSDLPPDLAEAILTCLAKAPEDRLPSAETLATALAGEEVVTTGSRRRVARPQTRRMAIGAGVTVLLATVAVVALPRLDRAETPADGPASVPVAEPSIAVLPFVNLSTDPANEYFSAGMTEELIDALSRVPGLKVVARTSSFAFKGQAIDVREIGRRLNVTNIVEGSVRKHEDQFRVTAQLITVSNGYHLWSETYERELSDVFAVQDQIARAIAAALERRLAGPSPERTRVRNIEAYQLYLRGQQTARASAVEPLREAIALYRQALALEPDYAEAQVAMADAYLYLIDRAGIPAKEGLPAAEAAARTAIRLQPSLAGAHAVLAGALTNQFRWREAEKALQRALTLNPNDAATRRRYSDLLRYQGRMEEGLREIRLAYQLDPVGRAGGVGQMYYYMGERWGEALEWFRRAVEERPESAVQHYYLGMCHAQLGQREAAIAAMDRAIELAGDQRWRTHLAHVHALTGGRSEALQVLGQVMKDTPPARYPRPDFALIHMVLGDTAQALAWLERAYREDPSELYSMKAEPELRPLHGSPRFQRLVRQLGLP